MPGPPDELVRRLTAGGHPLAGLEWHERVGSTNTLAADAAARGAPEIHAVLTDEQTAGRGRRGRQWNAPPGTSLLLSLLVRPPAGTPALGLLPLVAGLSLAEAAERAYPGLACALKWPNDLLAGARKAAGILVEALGGGACVVGMGVNVDWRGVERPEELRAVATSLAEALPDPTAEVDRWALLAALADAFAARYGEWRRDTAAFLPAYRERCATLGAPVRVDADGEVLQGRATAVADDGALELRTTDGRTLRLLAGDVAHVRPA